MELLISLSMRFISKFIDQMTEKLLVITFSYLFQVSYIMLKLLVIRLIKSRFRWAREHTSSLIQWHPRIVDSSGPSYLLHGSAIHIVMCSWLFCIFSHIYESPGDSRRHAAGQLQGAGGQRGAGGRPSLLWQVQVGTKSVHKYKVKILAILVDGSQLFNGL